MKNLFFNNQDIDVIKKCHTLDLNVEEKLFAARAYLHKAISQHVRADKPSVASARLMINKAKSLNELETSIQAFDSEYNLIEEKLKKSSDFPKEIVDIDIKKYEALIEMYMKKSVQKNWNEASMSKHLDEITLGNSGHTMRDIRQHLRCEVCIAISKYDPNFRTKEGRSVKESTFVFTHLFNRCGQLMKRLTRKGSGYGVWMSNIEEMLWEKDKE